MEKCRFNIVLLILFLLQYSFESLFRSMHFALLDNSCREYLFLADFFMAQNNAAKDLFTAVFGKTLSLFLVSTPGVSELTRKDHCMCPGNYLPTPPLGQH